MNLEKGVQDGRVKRCPGPDETYGALHDSGMAFCWSSIPEARLETHPACQRSNTFAAQAQGSKGFCFSLLSASKSKT